MQKLEEIEVMPLFPMAPVGDPQISPDGSSVLFTYSEVNMEEDRYDTQIWLLDLGAKKPGQFTSGEKSSSNPRWSPKGDRVLFTSSRPSPGDPENEKKKAQLFIIPADGGEARQITKVDEAVRSPAWSPDGRSILFLSNVFKGEKAEGSDVKIIRRMKYKHDGKGFSVGMYPHLFVAPARGGKAKQVTDGVFDVEAAVWSPDSERIAFVAIMGEDADKSFHRNIYAVPAKGGEPELLWEGKGPIGSLEWSPDGRYIAFSGRELKDPGLVWHKNTEVYVLDLEKGGARCLTGDFDRTAGRSQTLKWSPDSGYIYALFPTTGPLTFT